MPWSAEPTHFEVLLGEIAANGATLLRLPGDLANTATVPRLFEKLAVADRIVESLVLCHCESVNSGIVTTTTESFDRHYAVNVRASWQLIRQFAGQVPPSGGRIVALTSDAVIDNIPYGTTKAALDRLVLASARELAGHRILANLINPGPIDNGWMTDEVRKACLERQPTGRLGTPADTAHLVSFLLSERGSWINGQLLKSDGGFSA